MALPIEVKQFVGIPYKFTNSPKISVDIREGINCQLLIHLFYKEWLGVEIPKGMWSKEIFEDEALIFNTLPMDLRQRFFVGDIFIFGSEKETDERKYHLAAVVNFPYLIHSTYIDDQVCVWSLERFKETERYSQIKRVKRLKPELFERHILSILYGS